LRSTNNPRLELDNEVRELACAAKCPATQQTGKWNADIPESALLNEKGANREHCAVRQTATVWLTETKTFAAERQRICEPFNGAPCCATKTFRRAPVADLQPIDSILRLRRKESCTYSILLFPTRNQMVSLGCSAQRAKTHQDFLSTMRTRKPGEKKQPAPAVNCKEGPASIHATTRARGENLEGFAPLRENGKKLKRGKRNVYY
jgi:hypothetical protein